MHYHLEKDPEEKTAMLSFLKSCSSICELDCVGLYPNFAGLYPDVACALRINYAGRNLVEGWGDSDGDRVLLPLSVWPIVLERAVDVIWLYSFSDVTAPHGRNLDGLYFLLREGPALSRRCDLNKLG